MDAARDLRSGDAPATGVRCGSFVVLLLLTAGPSDSHAEERTNEQQPLVLLLTSGDDPARAQDLLDATSAHLSELGAAVQLVETRGFPGDDSGRADHARDEIERRQAISAFWWSAESSSLLILTPELSDSVATREIPDTGEGWATRCDAMAAAIQSELAPLLEAGRGPGAGPTPGDEELTTESITDLVKPVEPLAQDDGAVGPLEVIATVGWAPALVSTDGPFVHGADLGVGLSLLRYVELGLSLDLWTRPELEVPGARIELAQWPVRATVTAQLPLEAFDLGLRLGAVLNTWYLRGVDYELRDPEGAGPNLSVGVAASLVVRYRVLEWLAPWIEIGTDLYVVQSRHVYDGETLIKLAYARPRACIGVAFVFGVN